MKIIDLYNMVANGKQPTRFNYKNHEWLYSVSDYDFRTMEQEYITADVPEYRYLLQEIDVSNLNDEVEIIEEEKELEKINLDSNEDIIYYENGEKHRFTTNKQTKYLTHKINEIIEEINKLKKGNDDLSIK